MGEEEIKVKRGTKIEPEEAAKLDRAEMGVGLVGTASGDVEGQWHWEYVMCPWCGTINRCYVSDVRWLWFTCGWCGGAFRA